MGSSVKVYNVEVAKLVGTTAATLLNNLKYWMELKGVDKVYRTNKKLFTDFDGLYSESSLQRAKKKLVDAGLVTLSHELGHNRVTFFSLTDKAKRILGMSTQNTQSKPSKQPVAKESKQSGTNVPKQQRKPVAEAKRDIVKGFSLSAAIAAAQQTEVEEEQPTYDEYFEALEQQSKAEGYACAREQYETLEAKSSIGVSQQLPYNVKARNNLVDTANRKFTYREDY